METGSELSLDFSGMKLRNKNFKNKDLRNANFSNCDLRGANFRKADLTGANFSNCITGNKRRWQIAMIILSLYFSLLSAASFFAVGSLITLNLETEGFILIAFTTIITAFGLVMTTIIGGYELDSVGEMSKKLLILGGTVGGFTGALVSPLENSNELLGQFLLISLIVLAGISFNQYSHACIYTISQKNGPKIATAIATLFLVGPYCLMFLIPPGEIKQFNFILALLISISYLLLSSHQARRVLAKNETNSLPRKIAMTLGAFGVTNFQEANLPDATFQDALLKNAVFMDAKLNKTCFLGAKGLALAKTKGTILDDIDVRKLLCTGMGSFIDFTDKDLNNCYLAKANLEGAIFRDANLGYSNLAGANLKRTDLTRANCVGVNFSKAELTGACIEGWNVDHSTELKEAHSEYVYLLADKKERRPSSGFFRAGEFGSLFSEVFDTVDFIFERGVDWVAFLATFKEIKALYGDLEIDVQSIERKGDGVFVVKLAVPEETNKEELHQYFSKDYEKRLAVLEERYQTQLENKTEVIEVYRQQNTDLKAIINHMAMRPFQVYSPSPVEIYSTNEGGVMKRTTSQNFTVGGNFTVVGDSNKVMEQINNATISRNDLAEVQDILDSRSQELEKLVAGLKTLLQDEANPLLSEADRKQALAQIEWLAGHSLAAENAEAEAQETLTSLNKIAAKLPAASQVAKDLAKMVSEISRLF